MKNNSFVKHLAVYLATFWLAACGAGGMDESPVGVGATDAGDAIQATGTSSTIGPEVSDANGERRSSDIGS